MVYPLLAASHAQLVNHVAISTNSPRSQAAQGLGAGVIWRPPELCAPDADMGEILRHAVEALEASAGQTVEQLVVLLANAPAVTAELVDQGLTLLAERPTYDSAATVAIHNEYNPAHALFYQRVKRAGLISVPTPVPQLIDLASRRPGRHLLH